ncbi:MAG: tetratricopeptide repeat protein [Pyrinomonadaceae bacterium]
MKTRFVSIVFVVIALTSAGLAQDDVKLLPQFKTYEEALAGGKAFAKERKFSMAESAFTSAKSLAKSDEQRAEAIMGQAHAGLNRSIDAKSREAFARANVARRDLAKNRLLEITTLEVADDTKARAYVALIDAEKKVNQNSRSINDYYTLALRLPKLSNDAKFDLLTKRGNAADFKTIADTPGISDERAAAALLRYVQAMVAGDKLAIYTRIADLPHAKPAQRTEAILKAAELLAKMNKLDELRLMLARTFAIAKAPAEDIAKAHRYLADLYLFEKNVPAAAAELAKIDKIPNVDDDAKAQSYIDNGALYYKYKAYAPAVKEFERVHKLKKAADKLRATAYFNTGNCYSQELNYPKARDEWGRIVKLKLAAKDIAYKVKALESIGKSFYAEKNYAAAGKAFKDWTALPGIDATDKDIGTFLLALSYNAEKNYTAARAEFEKVLRRPEARILDRVNSGLNIVDIYKNENNADGTAAAYAELTPLATELSYNLKISPADMKQYDLLKAKFYSEVWKAADSFAKDPKTHNAAITIYQGFIDSKTKSGSKVDEVARSHKGIGEIYLSQNRLVEAKASFENLRKAGRPADIRAADAKIAEINTKLQGSK